MELLDKIKGNIDVIVKKYDGHVKAVHFILQDVSNPNTKIIFTRIESLANYVRANDKCELSELKVVFMYDSASLLHLAILDDKFEASMEWLIKLERLNRFNQTHAKRD
jgi:hypothetical protein